MAPSLNRPEIPLSQPRRVRVAYVSPNDLIEVFMYAGTGFPVASGPGAVNQLRRLRLVGVPTDAIVDHPFYDAARDAFGLVISHPSFDKIPRGEIPPTVAVEIVHFLTDEAGRPLEVHTTWRDHPSMI